MNDNEDWSGDAVKPEDPKDLPEQSTGQTGPKQPGVLASFTNVLTGMISTPRGPAAGSPAAGSPAASGLPPVNSGLYAFPSQTPTATPRLSTPAFMEVDYYVKKSVETPSWLTSPKTVAPNEMSQWLKTASGSFLTGQVTTYTGKPDDLARLQKQLRILTPTQRLMQFGDMCAALRERDYPVGGVVRVSVKDKDVQLTGLANPDQVLEAFDQFLGSMSENKIVNEPVWGALSYMLINYFCALILSSNVFMFVEQRAGPQSIISQKIGEMFRAFNRAYQEGLQKIYQSYGYVSLEDVDFSITRDIIKHLSLNTSRLFNGRPDFDLFAECVMKALEFQYLRTRLNVASAVHKTQELAFVTQQMAAMQVENSQLQCIVEHLGGHGA